MDEVASAEPVALPDTAPIGDVMEAAIQEGIAEVERLDTAQETTNVDVGQEVQETTDVDVDTTTEPQPQAIDWSEGEKWRANHDLPEDFKVSFRQDGEDKTLSLEKLINQAQRAQLNSRKNQEYRDELKNLRPLARELEDAKAKAENADTILQSILGGDDQLLSRMRQAYQKALGPDGKLPEAPEPSQDPEAEAGRQAIQQVMMPHAEALAEAFDVDSMDVASELADLITEYASKADMDWDAMDDIMNVQIVQLLEDLEYELVEGQELPVFDSSQYREKAQASQPRTPGLRRRGERPAKVDSKDARIRELEAQLQELKTGEAPEVSKKSGPSGRRSKPSEKGASSDLLDLSGAESYQDILNAMDKQLTRS